MKKALKKPKKKNIYDKYRRILEMPDLTNRAIDRMRQHQTLRREGILSFEEYFQQALDWLLPTNTD
jgi:hypothetical protein